MKGYGEGNFGGGTGPSFSNLVTRKEARKNTVSAMVTDIPGDNDDLSIIEFDEGDGSSPPRKGKRKSLKKAVNKKAKKIKINKWQDSNDEATSPDEEEEIDDELNKRFGNERAKRSSAFMAALHNAKEQKNKIGL